MRKKGNIGIMVLFVFLLVAGAIFALRVQSPQNTQSPQGSQPLVQLPKITTMNEETDVHHPDGTRKLIMRTKRSPDGSRLYSFFTADIDGNNEQLIFEKTMSSDNPTTMALPYNAWSPGTEKYVFIEETNATGASYLVLNTSGKLFPNQEHHLDVTALFKEKKIPYTFQNATGWASPTLLIFRTTTDTGAKGPSYWFEVPSLAFLQLAR
ncbi:hypothetical protein HYV22_02865 [Candidatus Gottesmanbacteria bacterium]|nr:hypothetical protein [Candidatus Gottesmanbacteria bacterium]